MSNVYMISDLHLGHKNILGFSGDYREGSSIKEHDEALIVKWNSIVNKKDKVFVLGDVVFPPQSLDIIDRLMGRKVLIRGNHDDAFKTSEYLKYFDEVYGLFKYKGFWLSHAPIHPFELRGKRNIHGHVHHNSVRDSDHELDHRYVNVCVENCNGYPVPFKDIQEGVYKSRSF